MRDDTPTVGQSPLDWTLEACLEKALEDSKQDKCNQIMIILSRSNSDDVNILRAGITPGQAHMMMAYAKAAIMGIKIGDDDGIR